MSSLPRRKSVGAFFYVRRLSYAQTLCCPGRTGSSPLSGTDAMGTKHRPFDNPHDAVREHGTLGGRRQSRWLRTADGFAVCAGDQYKIIKIKFVASMIAVTPATASSKASLASW